MTIHHVDKTVGANMRKFRTDRLITQMKLAEPLKISFQQIQKYETGANRISASRLWQIAHLLDKDIQDFFEGCFLGDFYGTEANDR